MAGSQQGDQGRKGGMNEKAGLRGWGCGHGGVAGNPEAGLWGGEVYKKGQCGQWARWEAWGRKDQALARIHL